VHGAWEAWQGGARVAQLSMRVLGLGYIATAVLDNHRKTIGKYGQITYKLGKPYF